jgi:U4/U6 small nuclear ribonucleoprotein PRP4
MSTLEYQDLNEESKIEQQKYHEMMREYETKKRARTVIVPTAPEDVKAKLREMGHPITLFGEDHADRRNRLKEIVAAIELDEEAGKNRSDLKSSNQDSTTTTKSSAQQKEVFYSPALNALINFRKELSSVSFNRAHNRIIALKQLHEDDTLMTAKNQQTGLLYEHISHLTLNASQFGEDRPLTSIQYSKCGQYLASGSFAPIIKIWDANQLECHYSFRGHLDRITSVSWQHQQQQEQSSPVLLASTSADGYCIVWNTNLCFSTSSQLQQDNHTMTTEGVDHDRMDDKMDVADSTNTMAVEETSSEQPQLQQQKQHQPETTGLFSASRKQAYLHRFRISENCPTSSCAFHPYYHHILGVSCHDYSWRLFDLNHGEEILLQDGHIKECSALAFHPDGSLVMTGDAGGVALLWDLRSGQMIQGFQGHIKKISNIHFHPMNGYQVATGSLDNSVKIWDLRKRKCAYTLPAHSHVISSVRYGSQTGETLITSSFDGSIKIWSSRDYHLLRSLGGHTDKVMACDIAPNEKYIVSAGYDRTIKRWAHKDEF